MMTLNKAFLESSIGSKIELILYALSTQDLDLLGRGYFYKNGELYSMIVNTIYDPNISPKYLNLLFNKLKSFKVHDNIK